MNEGLQTLVHFTDLRIWTKIMNQTESLHEINPSSGLFVSAGWFWAFIVSTHSAGCFTLGQFFLRALVTVSPWV